MVIGTRLQFPCAFNQAGLAADKNIFVMDINNFKAELIRFPGGRLVCRQGYIYRIYGMFTGVGAEDEFGTPTVFRIPLKGEELEPMDTLIDRVGDEFFFLPESGMVGLAELHRILQARIDNDNDCGLAGDLKFLRDNGVSFYDMLAVPSPLVAVVSKRNSTDRKGDEDFVLTIGRDFQISYGADGNNLDIPEMFIQDMVAFQRFVGVQLKFKSDQDYDWLRMAGLFLEKAHRSNCYWKAHDENGYVLYNGMEAITEKFEIRQMTLADFRAQYPAAVSF